MNNPGIKLPDPGFASAHSTVQFEGRGDRLPIPKLELVLLFAQCWQPLQLLQQFSYVPDGQLLWVTLTATEQRSWVGIRDAPDNVYSVRHKHTKEILR